GFGYTWQSWSPHIAVVTNISPNHIDWHGGFEQYVLAKWQITVFQDEHDYLITTKEPKELFKSRVDTKAQAGLRFIDPKTEANYSPISSLPGKHNERNARLAFITFEAASRSDPNLARTAVSIKEFRSYLADFPGLPHRLQLVAKNNDVRYFNDSKCTTPEAAMLAVEVFLEGDDKPGIHLILGGKDKGSDMKPLAALAAEQCKAVYTIGALGDTIAGLIEDEASRAVSGRPDSCGGVSWPAATAEVVRCGELDQAVVEIHQRVKPGDVVLLSPACASWDQFENYEQRGERFIELLQNLDARA
ncbi:MAG: Mur ligase family protein, partial [Planctomycetota bacterium]